MLTISRSDIQNAGGFLSAVTEKSCQYIRTLFSSSAIGALSGKQAELERIIVHTSPHLDEYFAELIFRSCLPQERWNCDFVEQSLFSRNNDLTSQHLWPTSAVLGIGGTVSGGVSPLFLFDEHVIDESIGKTTRTAHSCSHLVLRRLIPKWPQSLDRVLAEVNAIDEYAHAHEQNLANLIKQLHTVRFAVKVNPTTDSFVRDLLTPDWKRAIVDASITAITYCLQENIDLVGNPAEKKALLEESLDHYELKSPHRTHPDFADSLQFIKSTYGDQAKVFAEAVLKDRDGSILDPGGSEIPQMLLLSRVIFACDRCWGPKIRDIIATHFWEVAVQGQLNFIAVRRTVAEMFKKNMKRLVSPVGALSAAILPPMNLGGGRKRAVWLIGIAPDASVFLANKGIANYINAENNVESNSARSPRGCGLVLVQDRIQGTSALFKCPGVPDDKWERLVDLILAREPDCWHVISNPSKIRPHGISPFILNGSATHRYVPRTGLDIAALSGLVRHIFY